MEKLSDDTNILLISFYNSSSESEQLSTFSSLQKLLVKFDDISKKNIIFGGDFNVIFDQKFDASGGNPILGRTNSPVSLNKDLIFFLISNILQKSVIKTDALASFCTDHSPIFCSLKLKDVSTRTHGFWKFSNSLTSNSEFKEKMKNQILETLHILNQDKINDKHLRWEFLKYEIRKFTMNFLKNLERKRIKIETF